MAAFVVLLIGLTGGAAAGLQGPLAAILGRHVGIGGSVFIVHLVGTIAAAALLFVPGFSQMGNWRGIPWFAFLPGLLGILLVGTVTFCVPRIGAASTMTLMVLGQLTVASALDHYGFLLEETRVFDGSRMLGVAVVLVGTWLVVR